MLCPPLFDQVEMDCGLSGNTLTILADRGNSQGKYILSATLNGRPLDRAWVLHEEIRSGGQLRLVLGDKPGDWGTAQPPPNGMG